MRRFLSSVLPAFLLAVSVGQIYAFTNFSSEIAECIGATQQSVQVAFSLGIFFLGMGAAFFGKIVERDIARSTLIGTALFLSGLLTTAFGVRMKALWLIYVGYGCLLGLGTGVIYITPVKTMMLWFPKCKAIAAAVPIISFGLGSTLSTVLYKGAGNLPGLYDCFRVAENSAAVSDVFEVLTAIYAAMMFTAAIFLKKPAHAAAADKSAAGGFSYSRLLSDRFFIQSWLFMFLNISAGLCLIPLAKQMMDSPSVGYSTAAVTTVIGFCGVMNGGGRFLFAWISDRLPQRNFILVCISVISVAVMALSFQYAAAIGVALLVINACYGAGFSVIPGILADHYGMGDISKIHGAVLSAWGVAGLVGNQVALFIGKRFGGFPAVLAMLVFVYLANAVNSFSLLKFRKHSKESDHA